MKIICIGRNYASHIKELHNATPAEPVFFMKPDTTLLIRNRPFYYPDFSKEIHYEVELVLKISKVGKNIHQKFAHTYFDEIGLGIDFTARDIQDRAKQQGLPWLIAKGFDQSAPISPFRQKSSFSVLTDIHFHLNRNGETVQQGNSGDMIYPFDDILVHLSKYMTIRTGDLIFTGTPSGVGPVQIGDVLEGYLEGEKVLTCRIT